MEGVGPEPIAGWVMHAVVRIDGGLRYIDIWESREACDRFLEDRVHPILRAAFNSAGATRPREPMRAEMDLVDVRGSARESLSEV
jgi:hypothetical protein